MHKGPNTPPEPPNSPPSSPDAYDPFDPTKSRTPTPEPIKPGGQSNAEGGDTQEESADRSSVDLSSTQIAAKSHTPPVSTADVQPADSQSSMRATTPDTNHSTPPERPVGTVANQLIQSQASSQNSVAMTTSAPITSTPRLNMLNTTVSSSISQRMLLPNTSKSSPVSN